jgi:hypothetical protein
MSEANHDQQPRQADSPSVESSVESPSEASRRALEELAAALPELPPEIKPRLPVPFWSWLDVLMFFSISIPAMLILILVVEVSARSMGFPEEDLALRGIPTQMVGYILALVLLRVLLHLRYGQSLQWSLRLNRPANWLAMIGFGFLTAIGMKALELVLQMPDLETPLQQYLQTRAVIIMVGLAAVTVGPVFEELVFRGLVQPLAVKNFGSVVGIILPNVPFALLHGQQYGWHWQYLLVICCAGCVFGAVRHVTGSTTASCIAHIAYNGTVFSSFVIQSLLMFSDL